ncbi:hypothetical protein JK636_16655 [Clostridium sp. YIM B02515]|uniref:Uncharacterized protein n=1 Tax=Clostridium rhizosphaerae TaxID=2803861 RepID=A0ABS1TDI1_9CLOT|nr:hypothetical protein [Clostridium rhizosphaerae]MBL4937360.1 hypothetical protein [Clostridium rhizosphaerae]
MTIKSVREISYFQTLRDREVRITFGESLHFISNVIGIANEEMEKNQCNELTHMEKECITTLLNKLQNQVSKETEKVNLTFIEAVHLHNILEYFENNYDLFKEYVQDKNTYNQLTSFILVPASYYSTIFTIKNKLEYKLGYLAAHSYKYKHK